MVNARKKHISPLHTGKYGKLPKQSTRWHHHANQGKRCLEVERVRALGALRSLQSKKKLSVEKWWEMHFLSNEEIEKWIEDYVERETAVGRQRVQDAEIAIMQWLRDMNTAESMGTTTRQPETMIKEIWMRSETVWAILHVPTMSSMGKTRKMMKNIQSSASWVMMITLAGWWAQSSKQYSTAWIVSGRSTWRSTN